MNEIPFALRHAVAMLDGFLIGLALEVAAANVVLGMMVAWGYAGGDGEQPNPIAPIAGIGVFVGAVAAAVVSLSLLRPPFPVVIGAVVVLAAAATAAWFTAHPEDAPRRRWWAGLALCAVALPVALAALEAGEQPVRDQVLIAAAAAVFAVVGAPFAEPKPAGRREQIEAAAMVAVFAVPPALLAVAWLTG